MAFMVQCMQLVIGELDPALVVPVGLAACAGQSRWTLPTGRTTLTAENGEYNGASERRMSNSPRHSDEGGVAFFLIGFGATLKRRRVGLLPTRRPWGDEQQQTAGSTTTGFRYDHNRTSAAGLFHSYSLPVGLRLLVFCSVAKNKGPDKSCKTA